MITRGIQTNAKLRSLTKIDLNVMRLVNLTKVFCQKLQIRDSSDLQNLVLYPASILVLQLHEVLV